MQDHSTGRSRGFGFVTFDSEQIVEDILAHGKMHELGGKQVNIGFIGRSSMYHNFIMLQTHLQFLQEIILRGHLVCSEVIFLSISIM